MADYGFWPYGNPTYYINAEIEFEYVEQNRAARLADWVGEHFTAEQQNSYYEFIANVEGVISSFFEIVEREQSNRSPSYYFNFIPTDAEGNPLDEVVMVRFRISDHPARGHDNIGAKAIFKSFWFGGEKYEDPVSLIVGVERACVAIQNRDFSGLMRL